MREASSSSARCCARLQPANPTENTIASEASDGPVINR